MDSRFVVRPIGRSEARVICAQHPHAGTLPNSSKHYMRLDIDYRLAGLAVWGYGIVPQLTPKHLFGEHGKKEDYLELCRFFVHDWCAKNTASKFLAITHRVLKKYTKLKWLYTYAAGFQGLVGYIYKAAGYDYIGTQNLSSGMVWIPGVGLVHTIAQWHRFGVVGVKQMAKVYPGAKRWCGYNFRYIYWLCNQQEKTRLMKSANFTVQQYPTERDLAIWTIDAEGKKETVSPEFAKTVPIVKMKSNRAGSDPATRQQSHAGKGGAAPTPALMLECGDD